MYRWTKESIRFRTDAANELHYDETIAAQIAPYLDRHAHVCDAGCGLGYLGLALADRCARVTAVDVSGAALAVLQTNAAARNMTNLEVIEGDLFGMRPEPRYDAMVFCFFGRVDEVLAAAKAQCGGTVFLVKKNWNSHRFTLGETPLRRFTYRQTLRELKERGVRYQTETFSLEMGQPFRTLEDAQLFFETYRQEDDTEEVLPERVRGLLEQRDSAEFPLYFPSNRELGLIRIDVSDIP